MATTRKVTPTMGQGETIDFNAVRKDFPALARFRGYLDTAFVGLMPHQVMAAHEAYLEQRFQLDPLPQDSSLLGIWLQKTEHVRIKLAAFLGATAKEIAFTLCTGCGANIALNGLEWRPGDNVVTDNLEYPTDLHILNALRKKGVEIRIAQHVQGGVSPDQFEALVDARTRAIVVSHISYLNGYRHDLRKLADIVHGSGGYLIVDASQSVGCVRVNVVEEQVDFLSGIPYKWLTGPNGVGFLYIREELIPLISPDRLGWASADGFESLDTFESNPLHDTAKRYEYGTLSFEGIYALDAVLDYFHRIGIEQIEQRNFQLIDRAREGLREKGYRFFTPPGNRASILSFYVDEEKALGTRLKEKGFQVTTRRWKEGYIRISPHFYNAEEEIDALLQLLAR